MKRICKYCGSEMDLMTSEPNYEQWFCMNENCSTSLTLDENNDSPLWEQDGKE